MRELKDYKKFKKNNIAKRFRNAFAIQIFKNNKLY